ncbi:MAG: transposase [Bacteroidia bacterium]|nr:transposase [Bacteroidia bacterium]
MSTKYKAKDNDRAYFITITTVNWVDIFTRLNHKMTIVNSLNYCQQQKGLELYAYVLMPSHLHMMCRAKEGFELASIMRDFKKYTSKKILENIKEEPESRREWMLEMFSKACEHLKREQDYKVWQDGYHAEEISTNKFIYQKLNYIHDNPVKDKIVEKAEDYLFSSARNYAELDSFLEIELIPHQLKTIG